MTKHKIYLAHPISTSGEFADSIRVANEIRRLGFDVYAPAENSSINDKTNEPSPQDIYEGDISKIVTSDIFVINVTGGHQDGTISEIGVVAGLNEMKKRVNENVNEDDREYMPILAYTSNARLLRPQFSNGMASASANHLVLGMIERWGEWLGDEKALLKRLRELAKVNNGKVTE